MSFRRVLLTGTSGLGLGDVLERLKTRIVPSPVCAKAEEYFLKSVEDTRPLGSSQHLDPPEAMISALALPREVLVPCWQAAFESLVKATLLGADTESTDQAPNDAPLVLAAHMCYYHQQTREFAPLVDFELLGRLFQPDVVVTLVDDVEEMFERLRQPGQMYSKYDYRGSAGLALRCAHLAQLIHWRASESAFAEAFARFRRCPHYVLAGKHPMDTLVKLLSDPGRPTVYLSHPISGPRRQLNKGNRGAFDEFAGALEQVASSLRRHITVFEPTTIDEFRFRSFELAGAPDCKSGTVFVPELGERWPLPNHGEDLVLGSVNTSDPKPFDASLLAEYETARRRDPRGSTRSGVRGLLSRIRAAFTRPPDWFRELDIASVLVGALVGEIGRAVTARDLKLVGQCKHLVVVRPLFNGRSSGGVGEEIRAYCTLHSAGKRLTAHGGIWFLTCGEDEDAWRRDQVEFWLVQDKKKGTRYTDEEAKRLLDSVNTSSGPLGTDLHTFLTGLEGLASRVFKELERAAAEVAVPAIVPASQDAGFQPLHDTAEVSAAETKQGLVASLLEALTPPYLEWPIRFGEGLDKAIPVTICWGSGWLTTPQVEALCGRLANR
jgi:hypothetical protein